VHIWRVRKDGGIYLGPPGGEEETRPKEDDPAAVAKTVKQAAD
jgi:hypothetical protein